MRVKKRERIEESLKEHISRKQYYKPNDSKSIGASLIEILLYEADIEPENPSSKWKELKEESAKLIATAYESCTLPQQKKALVDLANRMGLPEDLEKSFISGLEYLASKCSTNLVGSFCKNAIYLALLQHLLKRKKKDRFTDSMADYTSKGIHSLSDLLYGAKEHFSQLNLMDIAQKGILIANRTMLGRRTGRTELAFGGLYASSAANVDYYRNWGTINDASKYVDSALMHREDGIPNSEWEIVADRLKICKDIPYSPKMNGSEQKARRELNEQIRRCYKKASLTQL